ncbi:60S ribosomal protein L28 [Paracoccidioides lutzii Pb01]|uniref:ATP-dependent DNA helicase CHL1 n=1 Tax=Paracoccidioides lutzii (strain ATCC MYA-826 / Pb01) TaxID=502779 RepID=C1HDK6_PARBA|nr:60S ribosomal protein L28 [Paracoccidioides lutzii Pb01]EEH39578.2 60S ribosomal protein L28 [Paracoccidioides lutzii Pb01]
MAVAKKTSSEKAFHHPFTPYDIQLQFMQALYECIEEGKVGIFESPTGTGKSLSLICGSLSWLRDHKREIFLNTIDQSLSDGEPEWILEHSRREKARSAREKRKQWEDRLAKVRAEEERQRKKCEDGNLPNKRRRLNAEDAGSKQDHDESQFELEGYYSDDDERVATSSMTKNDGIFSVDTLALLEKLKGGPVDTNVDIEQEDEVQVFYCSRTHSQLTQFAHELRRVNLPPSIPPEVDDDKAAADAVSNGIGSLEETLKHLSLGSRNTLCINPKVRALGNPTAINERCLEIQRPETPAEHKCSFVPNKENEVLVNDFRDHTLAKVLDIEDIGKIGSKIGVCPYYASRSIVKYSEIITLPYPLLLQRSAREALNISLKHHVVIIDEAHNLMDAISNIHSVSVSLSQLKLALYQLTTYARKYKTRLNGSNRVYVTQVIRLVNSISEHLKTVLERNRPAEGVLRPSDIMSGKGVDQINPHKLSRYLHKSKLARKVDGFIEHSSTESQGLGESKNAQRSSTPVLFQVQSFLLSLMNPSSEGKLFFENTQNDVLMKYILLDPTNHFREIVEDARAVILAGGTMSPMEDYADHLFPYLSSERLRTYSYGHVIPSDNLTAMPVTKGAFNTEFDFTYAKRNDESLIMGLGRTIAALCRVIPDGLVVFFPSYDYLNQVLTIWKKLLPNSQLSVLDSIQKSKMLFHESQDKATNTDELLQGYSNAISAGSGGGALLLSVMGGKLSEGINFSDRLGRGVIVVGLPFPNLRSAVWQAKIQHVEHKTYEQGGGQGMSEESRKLTAKAAGREFYENSCMRTVNQCIGRAIRHRNDYAAIIMMDRRYGIPRIQNKLPNWIRQNLVAAASEQPIERTIGDISAFFLESHLNAQLILSLVESSTDEMPTRLSKTRKSRGHVSAGYGRVGKHRKHPGGRGMAGGQHHHRTNLDKYHPGYFGKVGMRYFHKTQNQFWKPVINLDKLWSLVPAETRDAYVNNKKTGTVPVLDLLPLGYSKVLGKGRLPEIPVVVRARYFSKEAERKIKDAGGAVELVA